MIDSLIERYEEYTKNIVENMSVVNNMTEENYRKYDADITRVWARHGCYQEILKDLKQLKKEIIDNSKKPLKLFSEEETIGIDK